MCACVCGGAENDEDADDDDGIAFFILFSRTNFFLSSPFLLTLLVGICTSMDYLLVGAS